MTGDTPSLTLAVFDLDGTLTRCDTLMPFLAGLRPLRLVRDGVGPLTRAARADDRNDRDRYKEELLDRVLRDLDLADVERAGERFVARAIPRLLCPVVSERLRRHQELGHSTALASASPQFIVEPVARSLEVEHVVSTRIEPDASGRWRYLGPNMRAQAKLDHVRRLSDSIASEEVVAYGDSVDDLPLLRWADDGYRMRSRVGLIGRHLEPIDDRSHAPSDGS